MFLTEQPGLWCPSRTRREESESQRAVTVPCNFLNADLIFFLVSVDKNIPTTNTMYAYLFTHSTCTYREVIEDLKGQKVQLAAVIPENKFQVLYYAKKFFFFWFNLRNKILK